MKKHSIAMLISLLPVLATAGTAHWCSGKVSAVYLSDNGNLQVMPTFHNEWLTICSITSDRLSVSTEVCNGWLSMAMAARLAGTTVTMHYPNINSCATIPHYDNAPKPTYFMLN
jgi:hypothetical protein